MKVRWAIIGAGDIATDRFVPAIKKSETSELVAVIEMNIEAAKALAEKVGANQYFGDINELLVMEDSPVDLRAEIIQRRGTAAPVVERLDVEEYISSRLVTG